MPAPKPTPITQRSAELHDLALEIDSVRRRYPLFYPYVALAFEKLMAALDAHQARADLLSARLTGAIDTVKTLDGVIFNLGERVRRLETHRQRVEELAAREGVAL